MTAPITLAIPTTSRLDLLTRAVASVRDQTVSGIEVVVVDNASPLNVRDHIRTRFPGVEVIRTPENMFFAGAMNVALAGARTPFVAVLNDDAYLDPRWAQEVLATFAEDESVGSVATKVMSAVRPGTIDSAGDQLDITGRATNRGWGEEDCALYETEADVFSAAGACAVYRRSSFEEAGGFDDTFVAYLEDVDLGFRLQLLGYRCVFNPLARALHVGGGTPKRRRYALWLTERNMVWNIVKNMPTLLIYQNCLLLVREQGKPAPVVGGSSRRAWALGKAGACRVPGELLAKRRRIQANRRVSDAYIDALLRAAEVRWCHL
jgi:GT2 family glycosyltransferase